MTSVKDLGKGFAYRVTDEKESKAYLSKRGKTALVALASLIALGATLGVLSHVGPAQSFLMKNGHVYSLAIIGGISIGAIAFAKGYSPYSKRDLERMRKDDAPKSNPKLIIGAVALAVILGVGFWMITTPSGAHAIKVIKSLQNPLMYAGGGIVLTGGICGIASALKTLSRQSAADQESFYAKEIEKYEVMGIFKPSMLPNLQTFATNKERLDAVREKIRQNMGMLNPNTSFEEVIQAARTKVIRHKAVESGLDIPLHLTDEAVVQRWTSYLENQTKKTPLSKKGSERQEALIQKKGEEFGWIKPDLDRQDAVDSVRFTAGVLGISIEAIEYITSIEELVVKKKDKSLRINKKNYSRKKKRKLRHRLKCKQTAKQKHQNKTKENSKLADLKTFNHPDNYIFTVPSKTLEKVLNAIAQMTPTATVSEIEADVSDTEI